MKTYTVEQARQMVEACYGKSISDRTWRNWRNLIGVRCNGNQIKSFTEIQLVLLVGLAHLKQKNPRGQHTCQSVAEMYRDNPNLRDKFYGIPITQVGFYGRELPAIVERLTGKRLSLRTFYRIAKRNNIAFSINSIYGNDTLNIFLGAIE